LKLKESCKNYLKTELDIDLSEEKTKITNITKESAKFLGIDINRNKSKESKIVTKIAKVRQIKSIINNTRLYFYLPVSDILNKLKESGFIKEYISKNGVKSLAPNAITKWIFLDHRSIIIRYNAVIIGFLNYYGFVDNQTALHSIINFFLHHSSAKTLARKLNLDNRAKVFKKFGRYLETPYVEGLSTVKLITLNKKNTKIISKYKTLKIDPFEVTN